MKLSEEVWLVLGLGRWWGLVSEHTYKKIGIQNVLLGVPTRFY